MFGPIEAPQWKVGDEWEYRVESPALLSTFVWEVARQETVDNILHHILRAGSRQLYIRVDTFALAQETVSGQVVRKITPAHWRYWSFPLSPGMEWSMDFEESRPVDRQSEQVQRRCVAEAQETITVAAGAFATIRVACFNRRNGAHVVTTWYAPDVRNMVRDISQQASGTRTRELIRFKLK